MVHGSSARTFYTVHRMLHLGLSNYNIYLPFHFRHSWLEENTKLHRKLEEEEARVKRITTDLVEMKNRSKKVYMIKVRTFKQFGIYSVQQA